jgi:DNA invertase Pin-like site-specific DNA recombinase
MTIAAYLRVSSASQTAAMQRDAIERAARARGDAIAEWHSDTLTGGKLARPAFDLVRSEARAGRIRKLYVYRLDRLTRTGIRDTLEVVDELRRHGCELATIADGFDVAGPAAEIVLAVLAWAAKMERVAINERISAARVRVEAKGGAWGRPARMTRDQEVKVKELREAGHTIRHIAQVCGVPRATVARCLTKMRPTGGETAGENKPRGRHTLGASR